VGGGRGGPRGGTDPRRGRGKAARADHALPNGPGKLCDAFGISGPAHHGGTFTRGSLQILTGDSVPDADVAITARIGINPNNAGLTWPLRWIVRSSPCVSARSETRRMLR